MLRLKRLVLRGLRTATEHSWRTAIALKKSPQGPRLYIKLSRSGSCADWGSGYASMLPSFRILRGTRSVVVALALALALAVAVAAAAAAALAAAAAALTLAAAAAAVAAKSNAVMTTAAREAAGSSPTRPRSSGDF